VKETAAVLLYMGLSKLEEEPPRIPRCRIRPVSPGRPSREFHVSRKARDRYRFEETLFSSTGNVIFANFHGARVFAHRMNAQKDLVNYPEFSARAGDLNAMGLIDEILHHVIELYAGEKLREPFGKALGHLERELGRGKTDALLRSFTEQFPPNAVYRGESGVEEYLAGTTDGKSNRAVALEELLMLWLANENPAFAKYRELFDDTELRLRTVYLPAIEGLKTFFSMMPGFGPGGVNLIDFLRSPVLASPHSLSGQLRYIRENWGLIFGRFLYRLLSSLDLIQEEEKITFGGGPGPTAAYEYGGAGEEAERFSPDLDWMPKVVLIAKSTLVWLDQLSKKYGREIRTLDQIPDEEIEILVSRGFNALWLIGIWERSKASKRIKQLSGNPEAEASAYALHDYEISYELGGWPALESFRERCQKRGLKLASDMVPNHTGIDSRWVLHHPDWFIQLEYPPFPGYSYNGENLSGDPRVGVYLEDHYFTRTDAAVVFKRVDFHTGQTRYIYHGNDGTHMPWNDTAQLNYLNPEVREAVIQTILHVARNFSVIRFDAAMTLTKKHYQRLWFPEPGSGGDIASRAEHGLSKADFDRAMPEEFWREVVDRVAKEVPDTLLLAEAFWFMEGYFVRTLGMHRVYNSAFMNMLKNEENGKYRLTIKNTLEFDPEILKRFVNFMNNPDEETAVRMFGKEDKYFGVCTLMVTMPGLPMFGHGQIEGFAEKYGMEYRRAYWNEEPDPALVMRHEHEIFPLMKKRYLFADVVNFMLYDLYDNDGRVNENVFAYTNRVGEESSLVLYNNALAEAVGWIRLSAAYLDKGAERRLRQRMLGESLGLHREDGCFVLMREHRSGLWYIRRSAELWDRGLFVHLRGYEYQVFLEFREVQDGADRLYGRLYENLAGRGVPSVDDAIKELYLEPILDAFQRLADPSVLTRFAEAVENAERLPEELSREFETRYCSFVRAVKEFSGGAGNLEALEAEFAASVPAVFKTMRAASGGADGLASCTAWIKAKHGDRAAASKAKSRTGLGAESKDGAADGNGTVGLVAAGLEDDPLGSYLPHVLYSWLAFRSLGPTVSLEYSAAESVSLMNEWFLDRRLGRLFAASGMTEHLAERAVRLVKILIANESWFLAESENTPGERLRKFFTDADIGMYLGENRYENVLWFNREAYRSFVSWLFLVAMAESAVRTEREPAEAAADISRVIENVRIWLEPLDASGYRVDRLLEAVTKADSDLKRLRSAKRGS
jgi:glycosidase